MENYSQIEFLEIPETAEYKELIEKVVETCFNEENLTKTKLYLKCNIDKSWNNKNNKQKI